MQMEMTTAPTAHGTLGRPITVRHPRGMCHPAWKDERGCVVMACSCPGAAQGRLANVSRFIAEGWTKAEEYGCRRPK
jgi:hypothetical protein